MNYEQIKYETRDGILTITLNRPDKLNALNFRMVEGLIAWIDECGLDDAVRAVVITGAVSVLVAITSQLGPIKDANYMVKVWHVALTVLTVLSTWLFIHTLFAMHYAHDFYLARAHQQTDPIQFPGEDQPDYGDFLYAACIIGTSGQTADVSFASRAIRRVCLLHCTFSFFFNTTILALTINIAAGLF